MVFSRFVVTKYKDIVSVYREGRNATSWDIKFWTQDDGHLAGLCDGLYLETGKI